MTKGYNLKAMIASVSLFVLMGLSACGGEINLSCADPEPYQEAVQGERVKAPDDLDDLEPLREMPLPEASPAPPRPPGSPCIDRPPSILSGED
jgi:hypothetical protein